MSAEHVGVSPSSVTWRASVSEVLDDARADLERLVRIPSVWAESTHIEDTRRCAAAVARLAETAGAADVRVVSAGDGAPAVIATWPAPAGTPTVLLYAHHDVQPAGDHARWSSPPFEPVERAGRLYGRGAADDKAGVMTHIATLQAFGGRPPVGITLFVEGEEESGSPTLPKVIEENRAALAADVAVVADAANPSVDSPALTTSLRGLVDCAVEVAVLEHPVHSGMAGGPVADALSTLCRLLGTLHDHTGEVAIPGLVRADPRSGDDDEGAGEAAFRSAYQLLDGVELIGCGTVDDRICRRPAVAVLGIDSPGVDEAPNVLVDRARALVSLRIPPGDDPLTAQAALTEHLRRNVSWGAHVTVTPRSGGAPVSLETTGDVYDIARASLAEAFGAEVREIGMGGSIPFVAQFARAFPGATVLLTGVGDPESHWHGIDESVDLGMFARGVLAQVLFLDALARR